MGLVFAVWLFTDDWQGNNDKTQPNIIILLADDLGYGDLNTYDGISETPNLDKLAESGITFTDFYAPAPNCSPSRAGLLTGRNPNRVGMYSYRPPDSNMHLKDEEVTIAELLKQEGYRTGLFGKWHLGSLSEDAGQPMPDDQGFDYWLATENNAQPSHKNPVNFVRNGIPEDTLKGYSSHILAREANEWLERNNSSDPFFLYMAFHEVHKKISSPDTLVQKYKEYDDSEYLANVENLDAAVGKIVDKLRQMGEFENSLIIFSSDNGSYRHGSNGNLRGYKGESFEGGVRVPGIIHWSAKITSARRVSSPAGLIDLFPTAAAITNSSIPEDRQIDGTSLLPLIDEKGYNRQKPISWFFYRAHPEFGMRAGKYVINAYARDTIPRTHYFSQKDMAFIKQIRFKEFKMYNVDEDPLQKNDLSESNPQLLDSLKDQSRSLFQEIINDGPYWEGLPSFDPKRASPKQEYMRNKKVRWDM